MVEFHDLPRFPRRYPIWIIFLIVALGLFILFPLLARWVTDLLWYRELQRADVYWTMFWGRWLLGGVVGLAFFAVVFANVYLALRGTADTTWVMLGRQLRERAIGMLDRTMRRIIFWGAGLLTALFALGVGRGAADYWTQFLLFANTQKVGTRDPIFHLDIGFYLFRLPAWELLNRWLFFSLILALVFTGLVYLATGGVRKLQGITVSSKLARVHLSILLASIFLVKAMDYFLDRFGVLYSDNGMFVGAGFADIHALLPGLAIMIGVTVIAAVLTLVGIAFRNIRLLGWYTAGLMIASIVILGIYPALVQRFKVKPNHRAQEAPYIQHHIDMTRQAYGLDKVREVDFKPIPSVTTAAVRNSAATINNIRLWDHETMLDIYRQRQEIRTYYQILNVDIDRYRLNGQLRQVMLAARELNYDQVEEGKTWVNRHLNYTHGYGVVMSPVNTFNPEKGEPLFFLQDVPPVTEHPELKITRPEIYHGEGTHDYAVIFTKEKEFDYQRDDQSVETTYQEMSGVSLRNRLVRAMMASRFGSLDLLISSSITPKSRILFHRQILERAQAVAPFLVLDRDPYIVIGKDGRLYWIVDAYTRSIRYPYAQYTSLEIDRGRTINSNYVRNPVKIVIDAYTGATRPYIIDETEPFTRAWAGVFPRLFAPIADMPAGLEQHVRVPEGLFHSVSELFRRYHVTEVNDFYRSSDFWKIPINPNQAAQVNALQQTDMPAYFTIMGLTAQDEPEYLLIRPYTPAKKPNMIAWLSARSDPKHFGEMVVYNFPAQSSFYGPGQIVARINQQTEISEAFTLWNQSGSGVNMGNLLVIPMADSILYVQPIFLKAKQAQIPELKRVIVADQERVVMRNSLEEALSALIGAKIEAAAVTTGERAAPPRDAAPTRDTTPPRDNPPTALSPDERALVKSASDHLQRAEDAQRRGDWKTYGEEIEKANKALEEVIK